MSQRNSLESSFSGESEEYSEAIVNFDGENGNTNVDPSTKFPIKQLNGVFDSCAESGSKRGDDQMRVFLRVRPSSGKSTDSTITVESDTSIVTNAPENSKRAQYTKMEERHYVSTLPLHMPLHFDQFDSELTPSPNIPYNCDAKM